MLFFTAAISLCAVRDARAKPGNHLKYHCLLLETHKGLKRVTRVQCSWIFTFTIFGNLSDGYPVSTKWLLRNHHADVLRRVLHFKVKKYTVKKKNGKRKFKRMISFLFVEKGKLFIKKPSFEEFNLVFFTAEPMVCFEMQPTSPRSFLLNFQVHFALYGQDNYVFEREFMYF